MTYAKYQKYEKKNYDELMEYTMLWPQVTGIKDLFCFSDDGYAYIRHRHQIWFCICNGYGKHVYDFLPISVTPSPHILLADYPLHISKADLKHVFDFVRINRQLLRDIAKERVENRVGYKLFKPITEI
ncbi:MAG: hypothetical protein LKF33_04615 [Prevotella sp.]|nr:hypothetical protein [Prevotella sp.]